MTRRLRIIAAATAFVLVGAGAVTWLVSGRSSDESLDFSAAGATIGGARLHPGQAESYAAFLTARPTGVRFTISHVALIPLPGWRTPQLLGAEILRQRDVPLEAGGYPPHDNDGTVVPVHPTRGYTEVSGTLAHKIQDVLMVGLRGSALGAYATAGVRITYQVGGTFRTTDIYNAAFLYYYPRNQTPAQHKASLKNYAALNDRATAALQKLPGVQAVMARP